MNVLVTGSNGLLAPYIIKSLPSTNNITSCSKSNGLNQIDLTDFSLVKNFINEVNPNVIIHCAALTDVEKAEKEPNIALINNCHATKNLIKNISDQCHFIYISTDQVYSKNPDLHVEGTENPINIYGKTKWLGALEAKKHKKSTVIHTNMFGKSINNNRISFTDNIINIIKNQDELNLFEDAYFSPLHVEDIAYYVNEIILKNIYGTYNLGSRNGMSKKDFIIEMGKHLNLSLNKSKSIKSSKIKSRTNRTLDLRLNVSKIENIMGLKMPNLIDSIKKL